MNKEEYTPFKDYFADAIIAKNLLAENYCENCIHCVRDFKASKYRIVCRLDDVILKNNDTCEEWESREFMSVVNDI